MARFSIFSRLVLLAAVLLCVLIGTNLYLGRELGRNVDVLAEQGQAIDLVKTADNANVAFGDLKYWLADLAVSLLVRAEMRAEEARERLNSGARGPRDVRAGRGRGDPRRGRGGWSAARSGRSTPTPRTSGWSATR